MNVRIFKEYQLVTTTTYRPLLKRGGEESLLAFYQRAVTEADHHSFHIEQDEHFASLFPPSLYGWKRLVVTNHWGRFFGTKENQVYYMHPVEPEENYVKVSERICGRRVSYDVYDHQRISSIVRGVCHEDAMGVLSKLLSERSVRLYT